MGTQLIYDSSKNSFEKNVPIIMGGDIKNVIGDNESSYSMFEQGKFTDETFDVKHSETGLIGMV